MSQTATGDATEEAQVTEGDAYPSADATENCNREHAEAALTAAQLAYDKEDPERARRLALKALSLSPPDARLLRENATRIEQLSSWTIAQREYSLDHFLWEYARRRHGLREQPPPLDAAGLQLPRHADGCGAAADSAATAQAEEGAEEDELRCQLRRHIYQALQGAVREARRPLWAGDGTATEAPPAAAGSKDTSKEAAPRPTTGWGMEAEQGQLACLMVPALATSLLLGEDKSKTRAALCLSQNPLLARPAGAEGMEPLADDDYTLAALLAKDSRLSGEWLQIIMGVEAKHALTLLRLIGEQELTYAPAENVADLLEHLPPFNLAIASSAGTESVQVLKAAVKRHEEIKAVGDKNKKGVDKKRR